MSISERIKQLPINEERTLIVCNEFEEAAELAKKLEELKIPTELVKDTESECKNSQMLLCQNELKWNRLLNWSNVEF